MKTSSPESVAVIPNPAPIPSPEGTTESVPQSTAAVVPTKRRHRPHPSKISSLPADLRDFVNQSLCDHLPYKQIIAALAEKGHPGINKANITKWSKSGYLLWLQERERFNCLRLKSSTANPSTNKKSFSTTSSPSRK